MDGCSRVSMDCKGKVHLSSAQGGGECSQLGTATGEPTANNFRCCQAKRNYCLTVSAKCVRESILRGKVGQSLARSLVLRQLATRNVSTLRLIVVAMAEPSSFSEAPPAASDQQQTPAERYASQHSPALAPTQVETAPEAIVTAEALLGNPTEPPPTSAPPLQPLESSTPPVPLDPSGTRPASVADQHGEQSS
jgi:hypothetical protein